MTTSAPDDRPVLHPGGCDPTQRHVGVRVEDGPHGGAAGLDVDDVEIEEAQIAGVSLDGGRVTRLVLRDVRARSCSLVEVDLADGRWERVEVDDARVVSCVVDGGTWEGVTVTGGKVLRLSARQVTWRAVTWRDCDLTGLDLTGARLDRVRFERCVVAEAEFAGLGVRQAHFVDCDLAGARTVGSLRGATVDAASLASLAGAMAAAIGVRVSDPA